MDKCDVCRRESMSVVRLPGRHFPNIFLYLCNDCLKLAWNEPGYSIKITQEQAEFYEERAKWEKFYG